LVFASLLPNPRDSSAGLLPGAIFPRCCQPKRLQRHGFVGREGGSRFRADSQKIDEMLRQSPERASDIVFFDEFARVAG